MNRSWTFETDMPKGIAINYVKAVADNSRTPTAENQQIIEEIRSKYYCLKTAEAIV